MSRAVIGGNTRRLTDGDKKLVLTWSYTPTDAISDLVEALERLQTATSADCCWSRGPGEFALEGQA